MAKILSTLMLVLSFAAVADLPGNRPHHGPGSFRRPTQTGALYTAASHLISAIQKLDDEAFDRADELSERGRTGAILQLDQVADAASSLERALRRQVIRELFDHDGHDRFGRTLRQLESREYAALQNAVDALNRGGFGVQMAVREVEQAWRAFERAIRDDFDHHHGHGGGFGGPVTGTCNGKFGGNFFTKQSHVECQVSGGGLESYEVEFDNPATGERDVVRGTLDPRQRHQSFSSSKAAVGRSARFTVYVSRRNGQRQLLASGTCQGNPF
jgi:hypothetical protein